MPEEFSKICSSAAAGEYSRTVGALSADPPQCSIRNMLYVMPDGVYFPCKLNEPLLPINMDMDNGGSTYTRNYFGTYGTPCCEDETTCCCGCPIEWDNDVDVECGVDVSGILAGVAAVAGGIIGALVYKALHKD